MSASGTNGNKEIYHLKSNSSLRSTSLFFNFKLLQDLIVKAKDTAFWTEHIKLVFYLYLSFYFFYIFFLFNYLYFGYLFLFLRLCFLIF